MQSPRAGREPGFRIVTAYASDALRAIDPTGRMLYFLFACSWQQRGNPVISSTGEILCNH